MNRADAIEFLRPAVDAGLRTWADLGAGSGTFTAALATILDAKSTIYAVDNDPEAVRQLRQLRLPESAASIVPVHGDLGDLEAIPDFEDVRWDAAVLANVLHYFSEPIAVLRGVASRLPLDGRIVLVEYDRSSANRWVPHPIPLSRAPDVVSAAGFRWRGVVAQRQSQYQGRLYCAVLTCRAAEQPDPNAIVSRNTGTLPP